MKRKFGARIGLVCLAAFMTAFLAGCGSDSGEKKPAQTEANVTAEAAANQNSGADSAAEDSTTIEGGATMDDAAEILPNIRYTGTYREGEQWFAFRTGKGEDVPYTITVVNRTVGSSNILGYVCDKDGTWLKPTRRANNNDATRAVQAGSGGDANSGMFDTLKPNTTYFLRLNADKKAEYSLRITDPNGEPFDPAEGRKTITAGDALETATNMDEASLLHFNTPYEGKYTEGNQWFAFTTGDKEDMPYVVTVVNRTVGSSNILGYVCDKDGTWIKPTRRANNNDATRAVQAGSGGDANSGMFDTLKPNTTYFLRLNADRKAEYSLRITDPNGEPFDPAEGRKTIAAGDALETATNMDEASLLHFNTPYEGKYTEGNQWFAFTTGDKEDVPYVVTVVNRTVGSSNILGYVCDKDGTWIKPTRRANNDATRAVQAGSGGDANSGMFDTLKPNTTYFLRLNADKKAEYSLRITDPNGEPFDPAEGRKTIAAGSAAEAAASTDGAASPADEASGPATNMDEAPLLKFNTPYEGKYAEGVQWFAFRTGDGEDVPYTITVENRTAGSSSIMGYMCDEYGTWLEPDRRANNSNNRVVEAGQDGTPNSGTFNTLKPNTTYFLQLFADKKADYILTISDPTDMGTDPTDESGAEPGTSSSYALNVPLGTKVYGRYKEGYLWFAFTTTEVEDAEYYVTVVNCTTGSSNLLGYVCDKYGTWVDPAARANNSQNRAVQAEWDGSANSAMFNNLQPNTTYYIRMNGGSKVDYSLAVYAPGQAGNAGSAYSTSANITEAKGSLAEGETLYTGTNQDAATHLKNNVTYRGSYEEGYAWVSFTTDEREEAEYRITVENLTTGSGDILGYTCDLYGRWLEPAERANNSLNRSIEANQDGTPNTCMFNTLKPNTTYYMRLNCSTKADYLITVDAPRPEEGGNTIGEAAAGALEETVPEEVVFEVPFELNETQVRFKAESDAFIDPVAVEEALAPVAEIILQFPEHPILLAGTTATDGEQAARVELSERRAAAVKKVLVEKFAVPEEQLLTIGLGFEADPFERGRDRDSNGRFIETEGAKNRRVIVMDAESPVAKEILGTE